MRQESHKRRDPGSGTNQNKRSGEIVRQAELFGWFWENFEQATGIRRRRSGTGRQKRGTQRFELTRGEAVDAPETEFGAIATNERGCQIIHNGKRNGQTIGGLATERTRADRIVPRWNWWQKTDQGLKRDALTRGKLAQEIHDGPMLGVNERLHELTASFRFGRQQLQNGPFLGVAANLRECKQNLATLRYGAQIHLFSHDLFYGQWDPGVNGYLLTGGYSVTRLEHVQDKIDFLGIVGDNQSQRISRLILPALIIGKDKSQFYHTFSVPTGFRNVVLHVQRKPPVQDLLCRHVTSVLVVVVIVSDHLASLVCRITRRCR
mmetsp:Transcript_23030/g.50238  ORF Transcript_23030/g.50238 Transcript_23030/m.50238 type:complete len:320 (+) Transcript_23030:563-1522(+)